jgi:zinc protease
MDLLSQLLFSPTSDLFRKLVVEQQLVEFVQGSQGDSRDPGLFQVFTRVKDPKNIELVRAEIEKAIEDAKVTPIPEERLKAIKSYLKYQYVMGLDNPNSVANSVGHYIMLTGDPESVNRVYRLYDQITPEDIMGVAKKYMTNTNRTTVILKQEESSQ